MLLKLIKLLPYLSFIVGVAALIKSIFFSSSQPLFILGTFCIAIGALLFAATRNAKELKLRAIK